MNQLLTLTDNAANHIKNLMTEAPDGAPVVGLRVGVTSTGCSGYSYSLEYAKEQNPLDIVIEEKGVKLLIDAKAQLYIAGMEMDYYENRFESGFIFNNPNAKGMCGCGKSFKV